MITVRKNPRDLPDGSSNWNDPNGLGWQIWRRLHSGTVLSKTMQKDIRGFRNTPMIGYSPLASILLKRWKGHPYGLAGLSMPLVSIPFPSFSTIGMQNTPPPPSELLSYSANVSSKPLPKKYIRDSRFKINRTPSGKWNHQQLFPEMHRPFSSTIQTGENLKSVQETAGPVYKTNLKGFWPKSGASGSEKQVRSQAGTRFVSPNQTDSFQTETIPLKTPLQSLKAIPVTVRGKVVIPDLLSFRSGFTGTSFNILKPSPSGVHRISETVRPVLTEVLPTSQFRINRSPSAKRGLQQLFPKKDRPLSLIIQTGENFKSVQETAGPVYKKNLKGFWPKSGVSGSEKHVGSQAGTRFVSPNQADNFQTETIPLKTPLQLVKAGAIPVMGNKVIPNLLSLSSGLTGNSVDILKPLPSGDDRISETIQPEIIEVLHTHSKAGPNSAEAKQAHPEPWHFHRPHGGFPARISAGKTQKVMKINKLLAKNSGEIGLTMTSILSKQKKIPILRSKFVPMNNPESAAKISAPLSGNPVSFLINSRESAGSLSSGGVWRPVRQRAELPVNSERGIPKQGLLSISGNKWKENITTKGTAKIIPIAKAYPIADSAIRQIPDNNADFGATFDFHVLKDSRQKFISEIPVTRRMVMMQKTELAPSGQLNPSLVFASRQKNGHFADHHGQKSENASHASYGQNKHRPVEISDFSGEEDLKPSRYLNDSMDFFNPSKQATLISLPILRLKNSAFQGQNTVEARGRDVSYDMPLLELRKPEIHERSMSINGSQTVVQKSPPTSVITGREGVSMEQGNGLATSETSGSETTPAQVAASAPDLDELVDKIWQRLNRKLTLEQERRGYGRWL